MIIPTNVLRQGDPLLSYLFIMCMNELSSMLNGDEQRGDILGAAITKGGTSINYLILVDDCILYSQETKADWDKLYEVLCNYEKGSRQTPN